MKTAMPESLTDCGPIQAVTRALAKADLGEEVLPCLDRALRWHLIQCLQDRATDAVQLRRALQLASNAALRRRWDPWQHHWPYLMEILRDSERSPSAAGERDAISGRAGELLLFLVDSGNKRKQDVIQGLGMKEQQISNLTSRLEKEGLVVRQKLGREAWLYPTSRGFKVARTLSRVKRRPRAEQAPHEEEREGDSLPFWYLGQAA